MDRHVKWLRRRIVASIATQTAETFALVAVAAFALMQWRTSEGPLAALFGSVVVGQLVAVARVGHAMRNNPLNFVFMRDYIDTPFRYRVSRFNAEEEAHEVAQQLPGFAPVATIQDSDADPSPVFDVFHDPSRLVAASISRASGAVALISSLADGRVLVTDVRAMPPHERLVMNIAENGDVSGLIAAHRTAITSRNDVVELASSAHQVVLESLEIEYDAYVALGPVLSPFLDLEAKRNSPLRLIARVKASEISGLPARLGPDTALTVSGSSAVPAPAPVRTPVAPVAPPQPTTQRVAAPVAAVAAPAASPHPELVVQQPDIAPAVPVAAVPVETVEVVAPDIAPVVPVAAPAPVEPVEAVAAEAKVAQEEVARVAEPVAEQLAPVAPTSVAPAPVTPTSVTPTSVAPAPVAPAPVAPATAVTAASSVALPQGDEPYIPVITAPSAAPAPLPAPALPVADLQPAPTLAASVANLVVPESIAPLTEAAPLPMADVIAPSPTPAEVAASTGAGLGETNPDLSVAVAYDFGPDRPRLSEVLRDTDEPAGTPLIF